MPKTDPEINLLDEAIRAIREQMAVRLADPDSQGRPDYRLGLRRAADIAVTEIEIIRDAW
jgi:hypothetical protein